jgi:hypothetical protein
MSGTAFDPTSIIVAMQAQNQILSKIQQTLATTTSALATYTGASLPTTAQSFTSAWVTNGRANSSEGAGAGTGTLVIWNGSAWIAVWSGVAVTV